MKISMNSNHSNISFNSRIPFVPADLAYKQKIQQGLSDTFNLSCKIEDLDSIVGPFELKSILQKLKSQNYEVGKDFRANFHIHTEHSDGSMTVRDFLTLCKKYADEISNKNPEVDIPPLTTAITDHNNIEGSKLALEQIAKNPESYKNYKFVTGCEFLLDGYERPYSAFEAVGLGFNPFDKNLNANLQKKYNPLSYIEDIKSAGGILSWAHPLRQDIKINEKFFAFLKKIGVDGVEGNYQYTNYSYPNKDILIQRVKDLARKFDMLETGGTDSHTNTIF